MIRKGYNISFCFVLVFLQENYGFSYCTATDHWVNKHQLALHTHDEVFAVWCHQKQALGAKVWILWSHLGHGGAGSTAMVACSAELLPILLQSCKKYMMRQFWIMSDGKKLWELWPEQSVECSHILMFTHVFCVSGLGTWGTARDRSFSFLYI